MSIEKEKYVWEDTVFTGEESVFDTLQPRIEKIADYLRGNSKSLKQSYAAIFLSILTDIFAGLVLGHAEEFLMLLPGLVVLVPAALGMRGQIFASLGSRLGSALHLGTITRFDRSNTAIRNNILGSLALTVAFSVFLGILAKAILLAFGMASISLSELVLISFIGGILSGVIMLALTIIITFVSFRRGWDPDNLTSPMITALGDFFTVPTLLFGAFAVTGAHLGGNALLAIMLIIGAVAFASAFAERKEKAAHLKESSYRHIVLQSAAIIVFTLFLDAMSGFIIQTNIERFIAIPILLVILPAFLEEGGNVGNIMASRLATKLHLGVVKANLSLTKDVKLEFLNAYILSVLIFVSVAVMTFLFSIAMHIGGMSFTQMLYLTMLSGMMLTTVVVGVTFLVSILSFRFNIDPDNSAIPVITSVADVVGVFCLIFALVALHIA